MQGKGLVKFFLVLLILVTLYQFLLLIPTRKVESAARDYATSQTGENDPDNQAWKDSEIKYLDSMSNEIVMNLGIVKMSYQDLKTKQLNLGLDLKGGMSVIMQVDLNELIIALSGDSKDEKFLAAIQRARDREANAQDDFVTLFYSAWKDVAPGTKLATIFSVNPSLREKITFESTDNEVLKIIREEADAKVGQTFNLIQKRIDKYGVTQPNVTLDKATNRIFVELPGVSNPKRAQKYLQATAKLEFWETYTSTEISPFLSQLDGTLKALDGPQTISDIDSTAMAFDSLGNRIDSFYLENRLALENPPSTISQGPLAKVLSIGLGQSSAASCGVASVGDTAKVNEILKTRQAKEIIPKDALFLWGAKPLADEKGKVSDNFELFVMQVDKTTKAPLEGDVVTQARGDIDPTRGIYTVSLKMNDTGAKIWRRLTKENINRPIAIALDSEVVSAPNVQSEIPNGNSEITGNFTAAEATDLSNILEVGKLPAKTEVISQDIVGPSLGKKNIRSGLTSLVIGVCLVLIFMILYYGSGGIVSIIALFANLFFIIGALASYGTVLTLPGIAGIVLTIGMAVDANVIIYERIREELRADKAMMAAIRDGFKHSYSAIVDANVTTILTALVLAYFGTGPIKGFAVVLIIGVICSLFTAVLCARLMLDWWTEKGRSVNFFTPIFKDAFANLNFDFVSKGKIAGIVSGLIILVGFTSFALRGFELGVDFQGGRTYTIAFEQSNVNVDEVRNLLATEFEGNQPIVKTFGSSNQVQVTTSYLIDQRGQDTDLIVRSALFKGVNNYVGGNLSEDDFDNRYVKSEVKVGPTIADDIRQSAYKATLFALAFIFLYILLRFRRWQYGLGAVAALFHDVLIVLTLFSLFWKVLPFSLEINQAFIAAILTVVGYSINDTVVVFDRIREYFNLYPNKSKIENVNGAVNSTISRTIITSLTTAFVVLMLFIFGGEVIRGFAFALLAGIIVGTYSSVFVATPIVVALTKEKELQVTTSSDKKKGYKRKVQTEQK